MKKRRLCKFIINEYSEKNGKKFYRVEVDSKWFVRSIAEPSIKRLKRHIIEVMNGLT